MSIVQDKLSKPFFNSIIKKRFKDNIEILSTDVSYVVPPGENFTCELLRVIIKFSENEKNSIRSVSMIVKRLLEHEFVINFNDEMKFCACEFGIYGDILPMMQKLGYKKKVGPETYYTSTDSKNMIVIEDLSALNYKMANRLEGLNLEHCLLAIEKLAYFHATSLALYEKDPNIMDQYSNRMLPKVKTFHSLVTSIFQGTINACKKEPSLQKYAKKIKNIIKDKIYNSRQRDSKFNVLNHGDFWCNNLMFQYNSDGNLADVLFVDYQMSVFASPFFDLHYFIATSTNLEVKENHINDILHHYYNAFVDNVKMLEVKTSISNWKDFNKEFCDKAYMGLFGMFTSLPFIKASNRNDASMVNLMKNEEEGSFRDHCFTNKNYITAIKFLLPYYENLGVFDN